jgi:hypothetical protein
MVTDGKWKVDRSIIVPIDRSVGSRDCMSFWKSGRKNLSSVVVLWFYCPCRQPHARYKPDLLGTDHNSSHPLSLAESKRDTRNTPVLHVFLSFFIPPLAEPRRIFDCWTDHGVQIAAGRLAYPPETRRATYDVWRDHEFRT